MSQNTNIYLNRTGLKHDTGSGHPESAARLQAVINLLDEAPFSSLPVIEAEVADTDIIAYAHRPDYIQTLADAVPDDGTAYMDNDTVVSPDSFEAALKSAGAVCQAVDDLMADNCKRAFCAGRPPGHHAMPHKAMGFCLFNSIFIGARHAQEKHGLERICIVDFDVHHGNGTDFMARDARDIFYISSHQFPWYPGTGDPDHDIPQQILNVPLESGDGSRAFRQAYNEDIFPEIEKFKPDLMMISAGFDAHTKDPLGNIHLTEDDFEWVTQELCTLADKYCGGKTVAVLEGGYNIDALKSSVAAHLKGLADL